MAEALQLSPELIEAVKNIIAKQETPQRLVDKPDGAKALEIARQNEAEHRQKLEKFKPALQASKEAIVDAKISLVKWMFGGVAAGTIAGLLIHLLKGNKKEVHHERAHHGSRNAISRRHTAARRVE